MSQTLPFQIKRDVIVKKETATDTRIGCNPEDRDVEDLIDYGIIDLNKPAGPTSHQVADYVKNILKIAKAGHSGTLEGY